MKKTYIAPEMEIVKVQTAGMLAQSSFDLKSNSGIVSGSSALSRRRGGLWDDDDKEEDY